MKIFKNRIIAYLTVCFLVCSAPFFASCSTGTGDGETNVEDSSGKDVHEKSGHDKDAEGEHDNERGADR